MRICAYAALSLALFVVSPGCKRKKDIRMVQMGEKAEIGPFIYEAIETRWPMTLEGRSPKERFLIIRVSVLNSGGSEATIPEFDVVDDAGNQYPEIVDGTGVHDWLGVARKLAAANTEQGNIVFDVPPKHYRLRVADENDEFMYIDIPLNLNSEEPDRNKMDRVNPVK